MKLSLKDPGTRANLMGLVLNTLLAVMKFSLGILAASEALVADGFNSAGDIFATGIALAGYAYARKPADEDHHFGHGNAESVAGLIIGGILLATGVFIVLESFRAFVEGKSDAPEAFALYAAGVTIVVKEALYHYTHRVGLALNSPSLLASARDHRADVLIGVTVFAGILASQFGVPALDPVAAMIVGVYVAWIAVDPIRTNVAVLMDQAPKTMRAEIRRAAISDADVREVDDIRIHPLGSYFMVDLEVYLDGGLSLHDARDVAHRVAELVVERVQHVQGVKVHVNPTGPRPG